MAISRGFQGRRRGDADPTRVPPGQYVTDDFPVLSAGPTPHTPLAELELLDLDGAVDRAGRAGPGTSSTRCPRETVTVDIHCVTKWSKLDTVWKGVSIDTLARRRRDERRLRARVLRRRLHDQPAARRTSPAARRGSPTTTTASRSSPSTAARPGCSSRTSTSGRAPSGSAASGSRDDDEPGFWEYLRLPQLRRPVARAALLRATDAGSCGSVVRARRRDPAHEEHRPRRCRCGRATAQANTSTCA